MASSTAVTACMSEPRPKPDIVITISGDIRGMPLRMTFASLSVPERADSRPAGRLAAGTASEHVAPYPDHPVVYDHVRLYLRRVLRPRLSRTIIHRETLFPPGNRLPIFPRIGPDGRGRATRRNR